MKQLPKGFVLEPMPQNDPTQLPEGFVLEPATQQTVNTAGKQDSQIEPDMLTDVAKSGWAGIGDAIAGTLGLPSDLWNLSNNTRVDVNNKQAQALTSEQQAEIIAKLKTSPNPLLKGANFDNIFKPQTHENVPYGSQDIAKAISDVPGFGYDAKTTAGKLVQTGTDFAASTLAGGLPAVTRKALPKLAGVGLASGVTSEAAGQLTEGTAGEIPARIAGGILGGVGMARMGAQKQAGNANARAMIRERLEGVTDADFDKAQQIHKTAKDAGIDLTGPESFDTPFLDQLDSATRQSKSGGAVTRKFLENRNQQVNTKLKQDFGGIAPDGLDPRQVGVDVSEAASGVIDNAKNQRARATKPYYNAADTDTAQPDNIRMLQSEINSIKAPVGHPLNQAKKDLLKMLKGKDGVAETNIGSLDDIYKLWRDKLKKNFDSTPEQKAIAARMKPHVKRLGQIIELESINIRAGRRIHKRITQDVIKPLEKLGMRGIAKSKDIKAATKLLTHPELARPASTFKLVNELGMVSPEVPSNILRLHLENKLDLAGRALKTGKSNIGANFYKSIYTTENSKGVMAAMFRVVEKQRKLPAGQLYRGFNRTMDVLSRVARIANKGSQTQPLQEINREASKAGVGGKIASAFNITKGSALTDIRKFSEDFAGRKTYEELAEIFTRADSIDVIKQIANSKEVMSPRMLSLIVNLLNSGKQQVNREGKSDQLK